MLKEIAYYIESKTSLTVGSDLIYGFRPENATDNCSVVQSPSGGNTDDFLKDKLDFMIQIVSRDKNYNNAESQAIEIYNAIHMVNGNDLPVIDSGVEYTAMTVKAVQYPQYLKIDTKKRHEFTCNYLFKIRDT